MCFAICATRSTGGHVERELCYTLFVSICTKISRKNTNNVQLCKYDLRFVFSVRSTSTCYMYVQQKVSVLKYFIFHTCAFHLPCQQIRDFIFMVNYGHIPQNGHKTNSLYIYIFVLNQL